MEARTLTVSSLQERIAARAPSPGYSGYVMHRALAAQLRAAIGRELGTRRDLTVADVGCGSRPYEGLFAAHAGRYLGIDIAPGPGIDVVGRAEELPLEDASVDCVLCSQVLEHVEDPARAVAEVHRVLRPGGIGFISTHGVIRYHAAPDGSVEDYWRWTHRGLERLVRGAGTWDELRLYPNGGTWTTIAWLLARETEAVLAKARLPWVGRGVIAVLNTAGWNLDRAFRRLYPERVPELSPNYLVVARRGSSRAA